MTNATGIPFTCRVCGESYGAMVSMGSNWYCYLHKPTIGDRQTTEEWMKAKIDCLEKELAELRAAASPRSLAGVSDAGGARDGWRLLEVGEVVKEGDELLNSYGTWGKIITAIGETITEEDKRGQFVVRRRLTAHRAAPLPAPAAETP